MWLNATVIVLTHFLRKHCNSLQEQASFAPVKSFIGPPMTWFCYLISCFWINCLLLGLGMSRIFRISSSNIIVVKCQNSSLQSSNLRQIISLIAVEFHSFSAIKYIQMPLCSWQIWVAVSQCQCRSGNLPTPWPLVPNKVNFPAPMRGGSKEL